jgi:hypothetical protein
MRAHAMFKYTMNLAGTLLMILIIIYSHIAYAAPPGQATLIAPSGTIADNTPTYTWNAVRAATWYYLWVNDSTATKIQQWYTASDVGCANSTGTCAVTPNTVLAVGVGRWWVLAWNPDGYSPSPFNIPSY